MEQRNEMMNKITESEQFQNIKERMEKQEIKKAAKKIVGEQIKSSIETEVTDFQMSRLQHNAVLAEKKDKVTKKMCEIDLRVLLQNASAFFFIFSVLASLVSVFMSCAGLSNACSPGGLLEALSGRYWIAVLLMCLMQTSVIIYSFFSYALNLYHSDKNLLLNAFRFVVMAVSIYCNFLFIQSIIPEYGNSKIGNAISIILASGADIISNLFSSTAVKMKYKLYSKNGILANGNMENKSFLAKVKIILFGDLMFKIDKTYMKKMNQYKAFYNGKKILTTPIERCYHISDNGQNKKAIDDGSEDYEHRKPDCYELAIAKMKEKGFQPGDKVRRGMIGLSTPEWKSVRRYMQLNGIVKCVRKTTILEKDLDSVA